MYIHVIAELMQAIYSVILPQWAAHDTCMYAHIHPYIIHTHTDMKEDEV